MRYNNILLIDDDEDDREIFLTALGLAAPAVSCRAVSSAADALKKLKAGELDTDLIFLDLNMPVMNGQQFLLEIKRTEGLKNIPVVIFSTSSHPGTILLTKELGALEFITKPERFDDVVNALKMFVS